jgi:hypothetical protein
MLSLQVTLGEAKIFKVTVQVQHISNISNRSSGDRVVTQIEHLQGFVSSCWVSRVWLQCLTNLLHIIVLDVACSEEEDLKLGILLKTTS